MAIAGPFPLVKAHSLVQLFNRAYSKALTSVPLNPFMKAEDQELKCKFREWEFSAKDMMPITEEKVRQNCDKGSKDVNVCYYRRITVNIAAKELKISLVEKNTAIEFEQELLKRGKND